MFALKVAIAYWLVECFIMLPKVSISVNGSTVRFTYRTCSRIYKSKRSTINLYRVIVYYATFVAKTIFYGE